MFRILISDKLAQEGIELIERSGDFQPVIRTGLSEQELAQTIGEYDGLIVRSETKVTPRVLDNPGRLRAIARAGVGVDNIDVQTATRRGILVMNTPGGNTLSAAEHTVALMLAMSRNVVPACNSLKEGIWDRKKYMGNQLNRKVLGIIGLGRIGIAVARMAQAFDMKVLGYDPFAAPAAAEKLGVEVTDELERIFREADYITVHVPANQDTINMIDRPQLEMMKPTARLVNCARGGVINEDALFDALAEGRVAGAALDVFSREPPVNQRFAKLVTCLVTPHLGASTEEAQIEVAVEAAQILMDALKDGRIRNAVNAPSTAGPVPPLVADYARLAERIGAMLSIIAKGHIKSVAVEYRGSVAELEIGGVSTAFAIGLLRRHFEQPLNMVNVMLLAMERGISIDETKNPQPRDVASSFSATVVTDKITRTIVGSVFGGTFLRIIEIDGYKVEMTPAGTVLIIYNDDKPGVIGAVGTICGRHNINICTMGVGQKLEQRKAILAVSLDNCPDDSALKELAALEFVNETYVCTLD
jgi:D-3-phosphoglycerate dehydrogenase